MRSSASRWRRRCSCAGGTRVSAPRACPQCLRRAGSSPCSPPTSRRSRPGRSGSRSPELLRLGNEDLVAAVAPRAEREAPRPRRGSSASGALEAALVAADCWALLPARPALSGRPARRRRRALGADRPRRPDPARRAGEPAGVVTVVGARRATSYGREVARDARARAGRGRDGRRQRPRLRHRRLRPPRRARRRAARSPCSAAAPTSPTRPRTARSGGGSGERPRALRAAAGHGRLALDLPGPQPDHGGAGRDDRRGRGGGALGLADHRRPRRRPGPRPRRRPRPGHLARLGRAQRPARRRRLPGPRRPGRARRDARARASDAAPGRRSPRSSRSLAEVLAAVEMGADSATRSPPRSTSLAATRPRPLAGLELLGYVTCSLLGTYTRTLLAHQHPPGAAGPSKHLG